MANASRRRSPACRRRARSRRAELGSRESLEGAGAVRKRGRLAGLPAVLLGRLHLAEGSVMAVRHEHRIIAESLVAAGRPYQPALGLAAEELGAPIGVRKAEHGDEAAAAFGRRARPGLPQQVLGALHGKPEIAAAVLLLGPI